MLRLEKQSKEQQLNAQLSVVLFLQTSEDQPLPELLDLHRALAELGVSYELHTVPTPDVARRFLEIGQLAGEYILFLPLGLCISWAWLPALWREREGAEVVILSRFLPQAGAIQSINKKERRHNIHLRRALDLEAYDLTGGMLLCRRDVLQNFTPERQDALVWTELLVHAHVQGYRTAELPLTAACRALTRTLRYPARFTEIVPMLWRLWLLRNSIQCADYDARAFDSRIPFQRAWQRARYKAVLRFVPPAARTLDIGCGSSKILAALAPGSIGLDIQLNKLRFARRHGRPLVNGDTFRLPFPAQSFDCVLSSQVIEHLPADDGVFDEMVRVLRPDGRLIIGTPDYHSLWPIIERLYGFFAPNAYADEHITHYYPALLREKLGALGLRLEAYTYVFSAEWIGLFRRES